MDRDFGAGWVPEGIDTTKASPARVYDYGLGGSHNFAVDRRVHEEFRRISPTAAQSAWDNRAFLRRAVRFCQQQGIAQFLDLGSGVPTVGNVHEIAQQHDLAARVVYVDIDPVAVAHSRRLLAGDDRATALRADMRDPESILGHPDTRRLLGFDRPVAVLMVAVAHYLTDDDGPAAILDRYRSVMAPGSLLVFSHITNEDFPEEIRRGEEIFNAHLAEPMTARNRARISALLDDFDLVEPGLTYPALWRPDGPLPAGQDPRRSACLAAVGRPRA
ncbi:SAM-dependent methyltransferase [Saccharopolyspora rosea]|uniref:SAM-dependent methyltransferase n=1 Tax=Saccharopolyspora rosea TaxID=524884 RepID=A0ABW3FTI1_9PSEU|nr:SAM-dependent methyltransferase [Saccharopolyspora rosea]